MTQSALLNLPFLAPGQAQKHVTHNEALLVLDVVTQLGLKSRMLAAPPTSPAEGDRYLVAANPSGAWSGRAGAVAAWQDGAWSFHVPRVGWLAWVEAENRCIAFDGAAWRSVGDAGTGAPLWGVNATADTTNRLAVASPNALFNHAGAGMRLKINKATAGETASLVFQTGFSGRAEFGLAGEDDFSIKVSPDGATWREALRVNRSTGSVALPNTQIAVTPRAFAALAFPPPAAGTTFFVADAPMGPALAISDGAGYRLTALGVAYTASVTQRDPIASDDGARGYAAGDTWVNTLSGAMFFANSVSTNAAVWTPIAAPALPLDVVSGAAAAYGVIRLRSAYSGPALQLRRASDNATQDIGFDGQGVADWAAAATFAGANAVHLSVWYDQSGNGHHMTQPTTGSQPRQFLANRIGARIGLDFLEGTHLLLPNTLSLARQGLTAIAAVGTNSTRLSTMVTLGSLQAVMGIFNDGNLNIWNGVNDLGPGAWHTDEGVHFAQWLSGSAIRGVDDRRFSNGIATQAATMTGGAVGRTTGVLAAKYGALLLYPSALSEADVRAAQRSLTRHIGFVPQVRDRLVLVGDSITAGYSTAVNMGFAHLMRANLLRRYQTLNMGIAGQTLANQGGQVSVYTKFVVAGARNVAHVFSGTNDLAAGTTASSLQTTTLTFCAALKSGGFTRVIVATMLPRAGGFSGGQTSSGFETARQTYNTWLRANWSTFADALADYGGDATLGPQAAASNASLFPDAIHPSDQGHAILAGIAATATNGLG